MWWQQQLFERHYGDRSWGALVSSLQISECLLHFKIEGVHGSLIPVLLE